MKTTKQGLFPLMMLIASMVSMTILPSCSDKDDSGEKKEAGSSTLRVTPGSLRFDASGGTKSLNVYTDYEFLEADLQADWLDYDYDYSNNSMIINVTAKPNTSSKSREAKLTLMGSNNRNTTEERVTIKIEQDAGSGGNGQTFTIGPNGGKVEYDDLIIDFPSGTFKGDAKAVVGEAEKGSVDGACELSKCYNLELNADAYNDFKVAIKMAKASNDDQVKMMVVTPGWSISLNADGNTHNLFDVQYSDGAYVANIDAFGLPEGCNNVKVSFGLTSYTPEGSSAQTRIETPKGFKMHPEFSSNDVYVQTKWEYIPAALNYIKALGFEKDKGDIEYYVEPLSDKQAWGVYFNGRIAAAKETKSLFRYRTISINKDKVDKLKITDNTDLLQKTLIHETFHLYQHYYGGVNSFSHNTGTILDEATAVWSERFVGSNKIDFKESNGAENCYMFLSSLNPEHKDLAGDAKWKDRYQNVGYGMSTLIEYLSQKLGDGIVLRMYQDKKTSDTPENTIGIVEKIAKGGKDGNGTGGIDIFTQDEYHKFVEALGTGKVYPGEFNFEKIWEYSGRKEKSIYGTIMQTMASDELIIFNNMAYEYGALIEKLTVDGMRFPDRIHGLDGKEGRIAQQKTGVTTWVYGRDYDKSNQPFVLIGSTSYNNPAVIPHKFFPKTKPNDDNSAYRTVDFYLVTIPDDFTKEAESENCVYLYSDLKIEPDHLEFTADGGEKTAEFTKGNYKYRGSIIEYKDNQKDWLESWFGAAESGATKLTVNVIAKPNTSTTARSATITYWASDVENPTESQKKKVTLTVTQEGKAEEGKTGKNYSWIKDVSMSISKCDLYYKGNQYEDGIKNNKNIKIPRYYDSDYYKLGGHTDVTETANLIKVVYEYNYENGYLKSCKIELEIDPVKKIVTKISAKERDLSFADKPSGDHYVLTIEAANIPLKTEKSNSIEAVGSNKSGATLIKINEEGKSGWAEWEQYWPGSGDYEITVKLSE